MSLYASCPCGIPEGSPEPHVRTDCPLYGMTGDSDIVSTSDRLARRMGGRFRVSASAPEQADQADVLRERIAELEAALAPFAEKASMCDFGGDDYCPEWSPFIPVGAYRKAAALKAHEG